MNRKMFSLAMIGILIYSGFIIVAKTLPPEQDSTLLLVNQVGYLPFDDGKRIMLQTDILADDYLTGVPYKILNMSDPLFSEVETGILEYSGELWDHHYFSANISKLRTEGNYLVTTTYTGKHYNSYPFQVADDIYDTTLDYAYYFFYYQRCGCEVKELIPDRGYTGHLACHLDDANLQEDHDNPATWRNLTGAWHDAGDYNKYNGFTLLSVYSLAQVYDQNPEYFSDEVHSSFYPNSTMCSYHSNFIPDVVEEAIWGADFLVKCTFEDGSMVDRVGSNDIHNWYGYTARPHLESDNNNNTPRDNRKYAGIAGYPVIGAAALLKLSRILTDEGWFPERAQIYNETAHKIINHYVGPGNHDSDVLIATLELYQLTADMAYLLEADHIANEMLITPTLTDPSWGHCGVDFPFYALAEWAEINGTVEARTRVIEKFEDRWVKFWEPLSNSSEPTNYFNILKGDHPTHGEFYFWSNKFTGEGDWNVGQNSYYLNAASAALFAYNFTEDVKYLNFALRQLDWVLGLNPFSLCMMEGLGSKNPTAYHNRLDTEPGNIRGAIPGCVPNGIVRIPAEDNEITEDAPWFDFNVPTLERGGASYESNEPWLPHNCYYLLTASNLHQFCI